MKTVDHDKKQIKALVSLEGKITKDACYFVEGENIGRYLIHDDSETHRYLPVEMFKLMGDDAELESHNSHYKESVEPIDLIEAFGLNFLRGNVIKYVARAGRKDDELQDLKKAKWYLEREIKRLENGRE